jgi:hypothetical protein
LDRNLSATSNPETGTHLVYAGDKVSDVTKAANDALAKKVISMLIEKQYFNANPSDYSGYTDPYHKIVSTHVVSNTNDETKRIKFYDAIAKYMWNKINADGKWNDVPENRIISGDLSNTSLVYCFTYRSVLKAMNAQWANSSFDNDCDNSNASEDLGVSVCLRLENGECYE